MDATFAEAPSFIEGMVPVFACVVPVILVVLLAVWLFSRSGQRPANARPCPRCGGSPHYVRHTSQGPMPCPDCRGRGFVK